MDLQISVFLLLFFLTAGHSLKCYQCSTQGDSCADQEVSCPELHVCFSSTMVASYGNTISKIKSKGCILSYGCTPGNTVYNSANMSFYCCNTDLCNAKDAPVPSISTSQEVPNGKKCYYCYGQNCSDTVDCTGSEDHCIKHTGKYSDLSFTVKGCASKTVCDSITSSPYSQSISCCSGNLCNGAESVSQSFLFLCCSLLSFILLH